MFDRQETLSRVLESATGFVRFRYKAFLKLHFTIETESHCILLSEIECHIINNLLTELARAVLGNMGPRSWQYRTSLRSVRTTTTSGQYSPVQPSRSVSKHLIITEEHNRVGQD